MKKLELKIPPVVQMVIFAGLMWLLAALLPTLSITFSASSLVALILALAGAVFALLGVMAFRSAGTTVDPRVPDQSASLVTSGVYRISRNPMYVGFLVVLIGWGVFLGNISGFLLLPFFVMYMNRFQIAPEERYMREKFGDEYRQYETMVRRWV
ncbi:isoprenylcysteine carboxylmethyltransferase family protein [Marinobacter sp. CHS3-4]|uniref:methyltransferase family protein n=1 Tax=Marinobacter sp. CHS3-4 TaxID=3045174 RepID=UPI0024B5861D|nr:isoprenylcysteine carboxylmethyltransferase family protein [Marinobacter sp. CHS3-4]MDI9246294.1 isoprenylcysteine carboxylmethyltransferase family protein [Marinobacter sp. CHS3-4]